MLSLVLDPPQHLFFRVWVRDGPEQILPCLCEVAVGRAEGLEELEDLFSVLDALRRVDKRYMPPVQVVGVEERHATPTLMDGRKLVREVVDVAKARIEP